MFLQNSILLDKLLELIKLPFICFLVFFFSCSPNADIQLNKVIQESLKSNSDINEEEWSKIINIINNEESLAKFKDKKILVDHINQLGERLSRRTNSNIQLPIKISSSLDSLSTDLPNVEKSLSFKFFYENSASTDGYINGDTEFKDALYKLLTDIHQNMLPIEFNIINDQIHNLNKDVRGVDDFVNFLSPKNVSKYGNRGTTEINEILEKVFETSSPYKITILVSDYIYSISNKDVVDELVKNKYTTKIGLRDIVNSSYSILIIRINSQFNGYYYDMNDKPEKTNGKRPVYFWVLGKSEAMKKFIEDFRVEELKGYSNHILFQNLDLVSNNPIFYTVLPRTKRVGNFEKIDRSSNIIKGIKNIRFDRDDNFQFALAIDLSELPQGMII